RFAEARTVQVTNQAEQSDMKDKTTAAILALLFGSIGIHKFYLGRPAAGVMYLLFCWTLVPTLLAFVDCLVLALMERDDFNERYNSALRAPRTYMIVNSVDRAQIGPTGYLHPVSGPLPTLPLMPPRLDPDELGRYLDKLNELRIAGLLTDSEFDEQKGRLLAR